MNTPICVSSRVKGLPDSIDPNNTPRNYQDVMTLKDGQERAEA